MYEQKHISVTQVFPFVEFFLFITSFTMNFAFSSAEYITSAKVV